MAYTSIGFAVLDKFADRLWSGSREQCERMIEVNNWRDVMIVETFANRPRTKKRPRAQPKKRVVEAKHESGTILDFKTLDAAARFFELTPDKLYRYLKDGVYKRSGRVKGWKFSMKEVTS